MIYIDDRKESLQEPSVFHVVTPINLFSLDNNRFKEFTIDICLKLLTVFEITELTSFGLFFGLLFIRDEINNFLTNLQSCNIPSIPVYVHLSMYLSSFGMSIVAPSIATFLSPQVFYHMVT